MVYKSTATHLLALILGALLVMIWPRSGKDDTTPQAGTPTTRPRQLESQKSHTHRDSQQDLRQSRSISELSRQVQERDLEAWIASMSGDPQTHGQALVIVGTLTKNPDLLRQGIAADPYNPHLLFLGANFPSFDSAERLELCKRLHEADTDNAMAAYMAASLSMAAGNSDEALNFLKSAQERSQMNDFNNHTQLLMKEALISSGLSPEVAGYRSAFEMAAPYLGEMMNLTSSIRSMEPSMTEAELRDTQTQLASMGYRLSSSTKSTTLLNHLFGIKIELKTLQGLPDGAPSPYDGLTVNQAREAIQAEKKELSAIIQQAGFLQDQVLKDPDLMARYTEHLLVAGEAEAAKWLRRTLDAEE